MPALAPPPAPALPHRARRRRRTLAAALAVVVLVHLVVLYLPGGQVPSAGLTVPGLDKAIHVVVFAAPVCLAVLLGGRSWWALPFAAHAPVSEWLQHAAVPLRTGDPWDLVADLAGVALGLAAAHRWRRTAGRAWVADPVGGSGATDV